MKIKYITLPERAFLSKQMEKEKIVCVLALEMLRRKKLKLV